MKRQIKLLIENLFDDLYDIDQETNLTTDIADKMYIPEIGSIYYEKKKPFAICCGLDTDFQDKEFRYFLIKKETSKSWCRGYSHPVHELCESKAFEQGYENTLIIKNNYDLNKFAAFKYCCSLGDNVYLPAINEFQIMYSYIDKLNDELQNIPRAIFIDTDYIYWTSTAATYFWRAKGFDTETNKIIESPTTNSYKVRPFIKVKNNF